MRHLKSKIVALSLTAVLAAAGLAGCGNPDGAAGNGERITFWYTADQFNADPYVEIVNTYNAGQGKTDGVYVKALIKSDQSNSHIQYCTGKGSQVDLIAVNDRYAFNNIAQGFYTNLQDYVDDASTYTKNEDGEAYFDVANYAANNLDRYRFNVDTREAGEGEDLYALPILSNACVLYYNETYFEEAGIHIISVPEDELDAYNTAHGTTYAPRGYAEYTAASSPESGLATSKNLAGETVVKVFNNLIPMSFLEVNTLAKYFSEAWNAKSSPSKYGILNEWWFSHGWAVGGDCVKYDEEKGQYVFTLGSEQPNYLVTEALSVNGHDYAAGDILTYRDGKYLAAHPDAELSKHLYELPSQYEQFREFCAWSQVKGVDVDEEFVGYGISPSPATLGQTSKITYFTSGEVAMVAEGANAMDSIGNALRNSDTTWNAALMYTYREFEGEDPDPSGTLAVIGKSGFEGELRTQDGTKIVGKLGASSINFGYAIPANSRHKDAAWKFLQYLTSEEAQRVFAKHDAGVPSNSTLVTSEEFYNKENKKCSNYRALSIMSEVCEIGDWSYFENGEWITDWSLTLNDDVRNGEMSLATFFATYEPATDALLKEYKFKLHGKE